MPSRGLFEGEPLPSQDGRGFDRVPGSMAHLAEPLFNPHYFVPEGTEPCVAERDYYKVMTDADGTQRSVLVVVKGEKVDPDLLAALDEQQAMFRLEHEIPHAREEGRKPVSADPRSPKEKP